MLLRRSTDSSGIAKADDEEKEEEGSSSIVAPRPAAQGMPPPRRRRRRSCCAMTTTIATPSPLQQEIGYAIIRQRLCSVWWWLCVGSITVVVVLMAGYVRQTISMNGSDSGRGIQHILQVWDHRGSDHDNVWNWFAQSDLVVPQQQSQQQPQQPQHHGMMQPTNKFLLRDAPHDPVVPYNSNVPHSLHLHHYHEQSSLWGRANDKDDRTTAADQPHKEHDSAHHDQPAPPNDNNNDSDDDDGEMAKNPTLYGWAPDRYPNPIANPIRCAIAYLPANLTRHLRLCDPDWVLGGLYLEHLAVSMHNFSDMFAPMSHDSWMGRMMIPESGGDNDGGGDDDDGERGSDLHHHQRHLLGAAHKHHQQLQTSRLWGRRQPPTPALASPPDLSLSSPPPTPPPPPSVQIAVATTRKMNLPSVLRQGTIFYPYEDQDDMVNDAAQIFARTLHDAWWSDSSGQHGRSSHGDDDDDGGGAHGVLLFLSIADRVCYISTGTAVSDVLPWWRLDHVVSNMKPYLRERNYGGALLGAIADLEALLQQGPPTMVDRLHDFLARFGVVIAFALFTFVFGAWGEYRDRRQRFQYAESRSQMSDVERQKACLLQASYQTRSCPICLESFEYARGVYYDDDNKRFVKGESGVKELLDEDEDDDDDENANETTLLCGPRPIVGHENDANGGSNNPASLPSDMPQRGADGKRVKLLRCGHVFCDTCWKTYVNSGCGNPCSCPFCRQDVGRNPRKQRGDNTRRHRHQPPIGPGATPSAATGTTTPSLTDQNYSDGEDDDDVAEPDDAGDDNDIDEPLRPGSPHPFTTQSLTHPNYDAMTSARINNQRRMNSMFAGTGFLLRPPSMVRQTLNPRPTAANVVMGTAAAATTAVTAVSSASTAETAPLLGHAATRENDSNDHESVAGRRRLRGERYV